MLGKMWLNLGILSYFWALMGVPEAPDMQLRLSWDKWGRLMRRGRYKYESTPLQPKFNHPELKYKKYRCVGGILDCFWVLMRAQAPPDVWFSVPWEGWDKLLKRSGCKYKLTPPPHDFYHAEQCFGKFSCVGSILGCFQALMGVTGAPGVWLTLTCVAEMDLGGRMGACMNQVSQNMSLTIQSHSMENAAVFEVFRVVPGLWWGPRRPKMCESGPMQWVR